MRNLTSAEQIKAITAFTKSLESISIGTKQLVVASDSKTIAINPELTIDEIQAKTGAKEDLLGFIRQLYIRTISSVVKKTIDDDIANLPTVSFTINGNMIMLNY